MWRYPETDNRFLAPDFYEHVARVLELGKFNALFFADVLSLSSDFYKGNFDTVLGRGGQMAFLVPYRWSRLSLASLSTSFEMPSQLGRDLATLDWLSKGRIAWNVVTNVEPGRGAQFRYRRSP